MNQALHSGADLSDSRSTCGPKAATRTNIAQSDDEFLGRFQFAAFDGLQQTVNPANGLVADSTSPGSPCSIAVVGFALSCLPVGVERGWISRADAVSQVLATMRFFLASPQGDQPDATGHRGFYYHFLDLQTGRRAWQSELSSIDNALLAAGFLAAQTYFSGNAPGEEEIRTLADILYLRMDWTWAQNDTPTIMQGWKPESGFLHYGWEGYSEALILYVLAMGSPTHPLPPDRYEAWTSTYQWETIYGHDCLYAGPLFIHQFAHLWIDFRGLRDRFMREKHSDYFENSRAATRIQQEYALRNPHGYDGYGANYWGFSAGNGPGRDAIDIYGIKRRLFGYVARGVPYGPDDGTISPAVIFGALPFAPELALPAIRHVFVASPAASPGIAADYRVPNGLNPSVGWVSDRYLGLDQGLIVLGIENYRSQFLWNLMSQCPYFRTGLQLAGFTGGWLEHAN